ncbi:MAG: TRAP transporter substrate-binding protein [Dehalococcoidales bacterium]|nr:TRAP transporter substrate-binding protein [Dehalococcoidales bacterium]
MKIKIFSALAAISLVLVLLSSLLLTACANSVAPAPTTTAPTTAAPATTPAKVQTIKYGHYFPPQDFRDLVAIHFADLVSARSNGRIKIEIFPAEQLVKGKDGFSSVAAGIVDMYPVNTNYAAGAIPLVDIWNIPLPAHDDTGSAKMFREGRHLIDPAFTKNNIKILGVINSTGPGSLYFTKPVRVLEDFKGIKLRGSGGLFEKAATMLGMSVVTMSAAEQYMALQTKTIDGTSTTYMSIISFKLYEVAPYWLFVNLGGIQPYFALMNLNKWNGFSADDQKILAGSVDDSEGWMLTEFKKLNDASELEMKGLMKEKIIPAKAEEERWRNILKPLVDEYVNKVGPDGAALRAIMDKIALEYK